METKSFESRIKEVVEQFNRSAPPDSWERIARELPAARKSPPRWSTMGWIAAASLLLLITISQVLQCFSPADEPEKYLLRGEQLFIANCSSCHNINMKDPLTAPALGSVRERWASYPEEDLYNYIRNSQKMIADGHQLAQKLFDDWQRAVMPSYPHLSNQEMEQLLSFVEWRYQQN